MVDLVPQSGCNAETCRHFVGEERAESDKNIDSTKSLAAIQNILLFPLSHAISRGRP